jgi:hypothetical protein
MDNLQAAKSIEQNLRLAVDDWRNIMLASEANEQTAAMFRDTADKMDEMIDIFVTAVSSEVQALALMCLNSIFYGSGFINELLTAFDALVKGKQFIEKPNPKLFEQSVGNA